MRYLLGKIMDKYKERVDESNLIMIRKSTKFDTSILDYANKYLCRFITCSHEHHIKLKDVGTAKCPTCRQLEFKKREDEAGVTRITDPALECDVNSRFYKFNDCGHVQKIQLTRVRDLTFICRICLELKHEKEAALVNLILLRNFDSNGIEITYRGYREYQFITCGHIKRIKLHDVRRGSAYCNICQQIKIEKEAEKVGLVYLRKATENDMSTEHKNYGFFRFKECGHEQAISKTTVRNNSFRCLTCNLSSKHKPSSIYLIKIVSPQFEWLKLGFSNNIEFRAKKYNLPINSESTLIYEVHFDTGDEALAIERSIHTSLKLFKLCPKLMRNYMQSSGYTECYPLSALNIILDELNRIKERFK
jgi:hypothetical protein